MKKRVCFLMGMLMALSVVFVAGCGMAGQDGKSGQGADGGVQTIKVGFGSSLDTSSGGQGLKKFKELVESKSNGKIKVDLYGDGQLGNDKSMTEALQMGTLDMTLPSGSPLAEFNKAFLAFDLPFLFDNASQVDKVITGNSGREMLASLEVQNIKGLAYFENGFRNITNSKHPIQSVADMKGLKLRVMQNPIMIDTFKAWGANPTPMAFNEVFTALEQKTIDGQDNPNTLIYDAGFYEAQKYLTLSRHFYTPYVLIMSKKKWDSFSAEDQKLLQACADEAAEWQRETNRKLDEEYLGRMKEKGIAVNEIAPEEITKMKEMVKPIYEQYAGQIGEARLKAIQSEMQ